MSSKHYKTLTVMLIRETQIRTIMRYHLIPIRSAITPKSENKCLQGHEEPELMCIAGRDIKQGNHSER